MILTIRLDSHYTKASIIHVHAPTNSAPDSEKDDFNNQFEAAISTLPHCYLKVVTGDFIAQIGPKKDVIVRTSLEINVLHKI